VTPGHVAASAGRPRDAAERQRAVSHLLRPRLVLPPALDRPTSRRLAGLDDAVAAALGTGEHDDLLDDRATARWPAALGALVADVVGRLPSTVATEPTEAVRDIVQEALGTRLGFGPESSPDSPLLVAAARVGRTAEALETRGWTRVVPAARDASVAELVSARREARAVVTRHLRRVHLEVLPRRGSSGTPGSSLVVLPSTGPLVVVEVGRPFLEDDDLEAFEPYLVALADLGALQDRHDADARLREQR
jgi:hypothetical protein